VPDGHHKDNSGKPGGNVPGDKKPPERNEDKLSTPTRTTTSGENKNEEADDARFTPEKTEGVDTIPS
jgi:hypothetical protein